ncbi:aminoglycoside phosphotransferase family protein [Paenibacillus psychroresistens]|uniref:Aminoglycoside phosphotransferase family protein n=2 Tax=Paenibacillus psychroresistens TaxID=1778678 RepID=A0A6B8RUK7_9BACL|nr:aminoglycoside phosphotransferase family protein [Paenibacillus psychroresistens]
MLYHAIKFYDLDRDSLTIEIELPGVYHNDYHYKIRVQEKYYSARFISRNRYDHDVFFELTDHVLEEQMEYIEFLNTHGIPFMRPKSTSMSKRFAEIIWHGVDYRFLLFDWIEGKHITHCTESVSFKFGKIARKFHDVSFNYNCTLPKESYIVGSMKMISILEKVLLTANITDLNQSLLQEYIILAKEKIDCAYTSKLEFIMQSDLNPLNILWDNEENIVGVVDFEHIGYTDRIEGLAWLIKWYSRTKGIESHDVSPELTASLLLGYSAKGFLRQEERTRLSSLLWITGCLNWGFVNKTLKILENGDQNHLAGHLTIFRERGLKLSSLISE